MTIDNSNFLRAPFEALSHEQLYEHYRTRRSVKYFPVSDEIETERRKIEAMLGNRFEFNREVYPLPTGFDWKKNPSSDLEWHILLHKFYYAVGMGMAYQETQDERYAEKFVELVSSWIDAVEPSFLSSDVTGRRVQNWIFAHYYFVTASSAACLPAKFYTKFLASIHNQVAWLSENLTPRRNHRTLELYAIFLTAVVFPEMREAARWLEFSQQELLQNMRTDLLADGVQCELSTDYHHVVLRNYLGVRRLAQLNQIAVPAEMDALIQKALQFALHCHKPEGRIPALSDGDAFNYLYLLQQGYELYGDEEMLYVATQGRAGKPPALRSKIFPESGYCVLRSDWGGDEKRFEDARYLIFDCGPLGQGNHGHLDLLSFEMAAYGQTLVVDPGRFTYDESGDCNWRAIFRGTQYHNTVAVDRKNQTRYEHNHAKQKYKITGPAPEHELQAFMHAPDFDFLHGVARSHEYTAVHERKIFFANPEYWIITDVLTSATAHEYDLIFHLSEKALNKVIACFEEETFFVESPHLILAQPIESEVQCHLERGYVSPLYGVKHEAPVVRFTRHAANACFHTVLFPFKNEKPELAIANLPVYAGEKLCDKNEASALRFTIANHGQRFTDYYFLAHREREQEYRFADCTVRGKLLFLRVNESDEIVRLHHAPETKFRRSATVAPRLLEPQR